MSSEKKNERKPNRELIFTTSICEVSSEKIKPENPQEKKTQIFHTFDGKKRLLSKIIAKNVSPPRKNVKFETSKL